MRDRYLQLWDAHHELVVGRLAAASVQVRAAFAASCAEELYPLYPRFAEEEGGGDPRLVRDALDAVWLWAETCAAAGHDPAELADRVAAAAPRSDESRSELAPGAQNAAVATAAALDAWAGEGVDRVAPAGERVIEAITTRCPAATRRRRSSRLSRPSWSGSAARSSRRRRPAASVRCATRPRGAR